MTGAGSRAVWIAAMMGVFAVIWVFWGVNSLSNEMALSAIGAALVISALVIVVVVRRAKSIPDDPASARPNFGLFWASVIFEVAAAVIGLSWLNQVGENRFSMPYLALVVGIHFFGMGAAFRTGLHHLVGDAMCLLALLSLIWLPPQHATGADPLNLCDLIVGVGCAVILWTFSLLTAGTARG